MDNRCPACGHTEFAQKVQTFANGTQHLREECAKCYKFIRYVPQNTCDHEPISRLEAPLSSSTITPGLVGFNFFNKESWVCAKCKQPLRAQWKVLLSIVFVMLIVGCSTTEHRRELLQSQHPDCFVMEDLTIECPDPFQDQSAGFGTEVHTQKKKGKK